MIKRARQKAAARGLSTRAQFRVGDALKIPEPDERFNIVSIGFGVRNFADVEGGLLEAYRVLRPGGRLIVLDFFRRVESRPVRLYLDHVLPRIGRWISQSPSAYGYLRDTKRDFLSPDEFVAILHAVGFAPVVARKLTFGIAYCFVATKTEPS